MPTPIQIPREIPIIALSNAVLFPHSLLPLHIFEECYRRMLQSTLDSTRIFGVASTLEIPDPELKVPDLSEVMGIGVIRACVGRPDGTSDLILQGLARVRIVGETQSEPFRIVEADVLSTEVTNAAQAHALSAKLKEQGRLLAKNGYQMPQQMDTYLESVEDPEIIGDLMAAAFVERPEDRLEILAATELETRLRLILAEMIALNEA